jgi:hypothetical protein
MKIAPAGTLLSANKWVAETTHSIELLNLNVSTTCETQPMATHSVIS